MNFEHPLIFDVNNNVLLYISEKLSERLLYGITELKGNNVHILLPELFREQHSLEMKKKTRYPVFNKYFYLKCFIVFVLYNTDQPW